MLCLGRRVYLPVQSWPQSHLAVPTRSATAGGRRPLTGAWREMLEIWERQKREPSYQFDTPLPATAQTQRNRAAVAEENSIGDLAPEGLR